MLTKDTKVVEDFIKKHNGYIHKDLKKYVESNGYNTKGPTGI